MPMNLLRAERQARRIAAGLPRGPLDARRIAGTEQAVRRLLLGGVMPLWLGAGLADWYLHRRTRIEETSGSRESAIHALLLAESGVPVLLGLFCEVNAGVLASAYGAAAAHSATAYWDQAYAEDRRRVSTIEQHVHSLLEVSPLTAALLLTALHWDQAAALAGHAGKPRFWLRPKRRHPLPRGARAGLLAAVGIAGVLPYAEEFWRCWRAHPTTRPRPRPVLPATETLRIPAEGRPAGPGLDPPAPPGRWPEPRW
jgi:hypothetical protein